MATRSSAPGARSPSSRTLAAPGLRNGWPRVTRGCRSSPLKMPPEARTRAIRRRKRTSCSSRWFNPDACGRSGTSASIPASSASGAPSRRKSARRSGPACSSASCCASTAPAAARRNSCTATLTAGGFLSHRRGSIICRTVMPGASATACGLICARCTRKPDSMAMRIRTAVHPKRSPPSRHSRRCTGAARTAANQAVIVRTPPTNAVGY